MKSTFNAKLTLLEAALSYREDMTPHRRQLLFEGVFWLIDVLEDEIRAQKLAKERYLLSHIHELKEEVERCFKHAGALVDPKTVMSCCAKLLSCVSEE